MKGEERQQVHTLGIVVVTIGVWSALLEYWMYSESFQEDKNLKLFRYSDIMETCPVW